MQNGDIIIQFIDKCYKTCMQYISMYEDLKCEKDGTVFGDNEISEDLRSISSELTRDYYNAVRTIYEGIRRRDVWMMTEKKL